MTELEGRLHPLAVLVIARRFIGASLLPMLALIVSAGLRVDPPDRARPPARRGAARGALLVAVPLPRGRREARAALGRLQPQRADDPARPHPRGRCDGAVRPPAPRPRQGRRGGRRGRPLEGGAVACRGLARAGRPAARGGARRTAGRARRTGRGGARRVPGHVPAPRSRRDHEHALPPRARGRRRRRLQPRRRSARRDRRPRDGCRRGQVSDGHARHRARRRARASGSSSPRRSRAHCSWTGGSRRATRASGSSLRAASSPGVSSISTATGSAAPTCVIPRCGVLSGSRR